MAGILEAELGYSGADVGNFCNVLSELSPQTSSTTASRPGMWQRSGTPDRRTTSASPSLASGTPVSVSEPRSGSAIRGQVERR